MTRFSKTTGLIVTLTCIASAASPIRAEFIFGGYTPYSGTGVDSLNKTMYSRVGFNAIEAVVDSPGTATIGIDKYASYGWRVWGLPIVDDSSGGTIYTTGKLARLVHWEAEEAGCFVNWYGYTTCYQYQGSTQGQYWYVDPANPSHQKDVVAWELHEYTQALDVDYTALFYMKIDTIGTATDTVALIEFVTPRPYGPDSVFASKLLTAGQFPGNDVLFPHVVTYNFREPKPGGGYWQGPLRSHIQITWKGNRKLSMDSLVIFNQEGKQLARDTISQRRDDILAQANAYSATFLPDSLTDTATLALNWWLGFENNWDPTTNSYIDKMEPSFILDTMLAKHADQGFMWDRNLGGDQFQAEDEFYFRHGPRHFQMWDYAMVPLLNSLDLALIQSKYDHIAASLLYSRERCDTVDADLHYTVNAFAVLDGDTVVGGEHYPRADVSRPTSAELKCMSFLGLAYGVDGLWYWPYDDRVLSYRGLYLRTFDSSTAKTPKYYAVRDTIAPVVARFGPLIQTLTRRGSGPIADITGEPWSFVTDFASLSLVDEYVEAGLYARAASDEDYAVLVNRNTSTDTARELRITINATRLSSPSETHYYVINMSPTYKASAAFEDTTLVGPIDNLIDYTLSIEPGGARILKIVPAAARIAGTQFPGKWWGAIQANEGLTLNSNRSLLIAAGSQVSIHTQCGYGEDNEARFYVNGSLNVLGESDSIVVFDKVYDGPPQGLECDFEGDPALWGGIDFGGTAACTLGYCEIRHAVRPVYSFLQPLVMNHVATTNTEGPACYLLGTGQQFKLTSCTFDGPVQTFGGKVTLDYCRIDGASIGIEAKPAGQYSDTLVIKHSVIVNSDSIGIYANGYPVSLRSCTLSVADIGVTGRATAILLDTVKLLNCGRGVLIDTNVTVTGQRLHVVNSGIGVYVQKQSVTLGSSTFSGLDTVIYSDPGSGRTATFSQLTAINQCKKGIVTRSGTLRLDTCVVFTDSLTAIDAYTGSTVVRITNGGAEGPPSSAAAVSIGPNSRLVAKNAGFSDSWIGVELRRNGADTISNCLFYNNELYGIWCDSGSTVDLLLGNYIVNDTASALNFGINVLLQPIKSVSDTIMGGYNWNFNFNSGHHADVINLVARGKVGDDWGLVFNGPLVSDDSAFAMRVDVRDRYDGAHLYLKALYASIKQSHFVSTGNILTASPYGVKDMGSTTGVVRCTEVARQKTDLVYKASGSTMHWGSSADHGRNNIFGGASGSTVYFRSLGGATSSAEYCWWGSNPPQSSRFVGPVDYTPYETDSVECFSDPDAKIAVASTLPRKFALEQNYPNPFNPATTIEFFLPIGQPVQLDLFNVLGQRVRSFDLGSVPAGVQSVNWNGTTDYGAPVGSGIYFYRITTPEYNNTKKMLLLK